MYAAQIDTMLVADCGHDQIQCVAIYANYYLPHAVNLHKIGGHDITKHIQQLLINKDDGKYKDMITDSEMVSTVQFCFTNRKPSSWETSTVNTNMIQ